VAATLDPAAEFLLLRPAPLFLRFSYTPRTVLRRNNFRRQPVCPKPIHPNFKGSGTMKTNGNNSPKS
jgi:hypothetical protein